MLMRYVKGFYKIKEKEFVMDKLKKIKFNGTQLKFIALLAMLVDHIGYAFFPDVMVFRAIGRVAFPIFAFLVTEGMVHTSNWKKYFL